MELNLLRRVKKYSLSVLLRVTTVAAVHVPKKPGLRVAVKSRKFGDEIGAEVVTRSDPGVEVVTDQFAVGWNLIPTRRPDPLDPPDATIISNFREKERERSEK